MAQDTTEIVMTLADGSNGAEAADGASVPSVHAAPAAPSIMPTLFVFMLASFIGMGVIRRVSRLLHTPLMSLTNAISAIAVVGAIIVAGGKDYPTWIRLLGAVALFASMTNIISGFLITDRMLKMFKDNKGEAKQRGSEAAKQGEAAGGKA